MPKAEGGLRRSTPFPSSSLWYRRDPLSLCDIFPGFAGESESEQDLIWLRRFGQLGDFEDGCSAGVLADV